MRSPSTSSAYHLAVQVIQSASLTAIQIPKNDDTVQIPKNDDTAQIPTT